MNAWPEATSVERFLIRVRRRMVVLRALEGAACGLGVAALLVLAGVRSNPLLVATVIVLSATRVALGDRWRFGWWRSVTGIAEQLERRTAKPRNLLVTASELLGSSRGYVNDAVMSRASRVVIDLDLGELFPSRSAVGATAIAALVLMAVLLQPTITRRVVQVLPFSAAVPRVHRIQVTVVPPTYSGLSRRTTINPSRIDALAGSRIEIAVDAAATSVALESIAGTQRMRSEGGAYSAAYNAATDGFLAIEPRDAAGRSGARQIIGLSVTPDAAPQVKLTTPARDLFFATVPDTLSVAISANDDLALSSLLLRYTAVSGSGERFTFTEREVPLTVSRSNPGNWSARGTWRLDELQLAPGDMIVYRAVARDNRPGSAPVESDSYVLEVVTPGAIAAEGFAADDRRDRYAVSQQMVILKTERLIARRPSLKPDSLSYESRSLAAEQRQVRAEFVFMMGGELEDLAAETSGTLEVNEVAEAEAEGDLLAGRQQNQGRVEMMRAIRAMSRASTALNESNLDQALRDERTALDNLMRAFARSRFILRALTQRERIDLERRLSGSLTLTAGLSLPTAEATPDSKTVALRRLLADLAALSSGDSAAGNRAQAAAVTVLRTDPGSEEIRRLVSRIQDVASRPNVTADIDSMLTAVTALLKRSLPSAPQASLSPAAGVLEGALRDASRRRP